MKKIILYVKTKQINNKKEYLLLSKEHSSTKTNHFKQLSQIMPNHAFYDIIKNNISHLYKVLHLN